MTSAFRHALIGLMFVTLLAGCATDSKAPVGPPADIEYVNEVAAAESSYSRGLTTEAATFYRRALVRARAMDNPSLIGEAAYDLAACELELHQYTLASQLLDEARDEMIRSGQNIADVLLVQAKVARLDDHPDEALKLCDQVLSGPGSSPTDGHRSQVHLLRGQIACVAGNVPTARAELSEARKLTGAAPGPARAAGMANLAAMIDERAGNPASAAAEYDREAALSREAGLYPEMVHALAHAGAAYGAASQPQPAGERLFRAARSALAQGDKTFAREYLDAAIASATKASDDNTLGKAHSLEGELGASTRASE